MWDHSAPDLERRTGTHRMDLKMMERIDVLWMSARYRSKGPQNMSANVQCSSSMAKGEGEVRVYGEKRVPSHMTDQRKRPQSTGETESFSCQDMVPQPWP